MGSGYVLGSVYLLILVFSNAGIMYAHLAIFWCSDKERHITIPANQLTANMMLYWT